jgi:hypothetical protein
MAFFTGRGNGGNGCINRRNGRGLAARLLARGTRRLQGAHCMGLRPVARGSSRAGAGRDSARARASRRGHGLDGALLAPWSGAGEAGRPSAAAGVAGALSLLADAQGERCGISALKREREGMGEKERDERRGEREHRRRRLGW